VPCVGKGMCDALGNGINEQLADGAVCSLCGVALVRNAMRIFSAS
jgi:hypothetical protein